MQVVWDKYYHHSGDRPFHEVAFYTNCLKCIDIVDPYHPDRVLRQFGTIQAIPFTPLAPVRAYHESTANQYHIAYQYLDRVWESWANHLLSPLNSGAPVTQSHDCAHGYIDWYARVSHPLIKEPTKRSTLNPRM